MTAAAFQAGDHRASRPAFLDVPMDIFYGPHRRPDLVRHATSTAALTRCRLRVAGMLAFGATPGADPGSDVWNKLRRADRRATPRSRLASAGDPNGMGRGKKSAATHCW